MQIRLVACPHLCWPPTHLEEEQSGVDVPTDVIDTSEHTRNIAPRLDDALVFQRGCALFDGLGPGLQSHGLVLEDKQLMRDGESAIGRTAGILALWRLKVHGQHGGEVELRSVLFTPGGEDCVGQANLVTALAGMLELQPAPWRAPRNRRCLHSRRNRRRPRWKVAYD